MGSRRAGEAGPEEAVGKAKEADAAVWRSRFLTLLDRSPTPTAIAGTNGLVSVANPAFAGALGLQPGRVANRLLLDLLTPTNSEQLRKLDEAMRSGRRSRYPVEACWAAGGTTRHGQVTVEPVTDPLEDTPPLMVTLRVAEERDEPTRNGAAVRTGGPGTADAGEELTHPALNAQEARILRLVAGGATTSVVARTVGIGVDGVNYHLTRLCRRLQVPNRTALVARAYVLGLLDAQAWPPQASGPVGRRGGPARGGAGTRT
ncbi:PAS domain-containing protein [Streptomyces atriruber]|uniref:PAS domain-containing protein n=1 Tax=Streptomyces atriruber TaxID=545121 RepID=A0ABV3BWT8_9ACTN